MATRRIPVLVAPMFLVSGPELVIAAAHAGIVAAFPAPNARDTDTLAQWMAQTQQGASNGSWGVNMIVHKSYDRFDEELELVKEFKPPIVSTALGSPRRVANIVQGYGGIVIADVTTPTLAKKAAEAGVDALIAVSHGAGGHTGQYHPFALINEIRQFWKGPLGLAGAITTGREIRAAQILGADFVVMGTRFIATQESLASTAYQDMLITCGLEDLIASDSISGVMANWLRPSLENHPAYSDAPPEKPDISFSGNISAGSRAWKDTWSAGHGVGSIQAVQSVEQVVSQLQHEYNQYSL